MYTSIQGHLGQFWFMHRSSYMCILLKPAMKKLGNARALDTASLLGGLMRDHWVSMVKDPLPLIMK